MKAHSQTVRQRTLTPSFSRFESLWACSYKSYQVIGSSFYLHELMVEKMIELGKRQKLKIVLRKKFGVYLAPPEHTEERVLLPAKQVPEGSQIGDEVEVFIYRDSSDRLIATTTQPLITLGETAMLTVRQNAKIGAFLDWGLEKDLLLPFREQTAPVREGHAYLVMLYVDKTGRLCATMKLYHHLRCDAPYRKDDLVQATVYDSSREFGIFAAVDNRYSALIPRREYRRDIPIGTVIKARVTDVKPDGKLDLSVREKAYLQIDEDADMVFALLDEYDGVLPFTENSPAEVIARETGLSKNAFKRAVGRLYKEGKIDLKDKKIRKKTEES